MPTSLAMAEPLDTSAVSTSELPKEPICDWLFAASFGDDWAGISLEGTRVNFWEDDWVDGRSGICQDDQISLFTEPTNRETPEVDRVLGELSVRDGALIIDGELGEMQATSFQTWDSATALTVPGDPALANAHGFGIQLIERLFDGDLTLYTNSATDPFVSLEDGDVQVFPKGQLEQILKDDRQEILGNVDGHTLRDYLSSFDPSIRDIDFFGEQNAEDLRALHPDAMITFFHGENERDRPPSMSSSYWFNFLLVSHDGGETWQVAGL